MSHKDTYQSYFGSGAGAGGSGAGGFDPGGFGPGFPGGPGGPYGPQYGDWSSPPPPRKKSNGGWIALGIIAAVVVALFSIGAAVRGLFNQEDLPEHVEEPADEKFGEAARIFDGQAPDAQDVELKRIQAMFEQANAAVTGKEFFDHVNMDRMLLELKAAGMRIPAAQSQEFVQGLRTGMEGAFDRDRWLIFNRDAKIETRHVRYLPRQGEALAFVRIRAADGVATKLRFWLRKEDGRWRMFDWEDLSTSLRATTSIAVLSQSRAVQTIQFRQATDGHRAAIGAIVAGDFAAARTALESMPNVDLPTQLDSVVEMAWGIVCLAESKFDDALTHIDRALALNSAAPMFHLVRAQALIGLGNFPQAQREAQRYLELLGEDDEGYRVLGDALKGAGDFANAAAAYRKSLDDFADNQDSLYGLAVVLPEDQKSEIAGRLKACTKISERFGNIAAALEETSEITALQALVAAYEPIAQDDQNLDYYRGVVHLRSGRHQDAADALRPRLKDDVGNTYLTLRYLEAMHGLGRPLEAYQEAKDKVYAFATLADWLSQDATQHPQLEQLIDAHVQAHAEDTRIPFHRGRVHLEKNDPAAAQAEFLDALRRATEPDKATYASWYLTAALKAGQPLDGYRNSPDKPAAFRQLAAGLEFRGGGELEALITAHQQDNPQDLIPAYYLARRDRRAQRYEAALDKLRPALRDLPPGADRDMVRGELLRAAWLAKKPLVAYAELLEKEEAFRALAEFAVSDEEPEQLAALIAAHERMSPADPWLPFYRGQWHTLRVEHAAAAVQFDLASRRLPHENRGYAQSLHFQAMATAGKALDAYQATLDKVQAMASLAWQLNGDELERLLAAHEAVFPHDKALSLHRARLHFEREQYDQAAEVASAALAKAAADDPWRWSLQYRLIEARLATDNWRAAYEESKDKVAAFPAVATRLSAKKRSDELSSLIELHKANSPDDPMLALYAARVAEWGGDLEQADRLLAAGAAKLEHEWRRFEFLNERVRLKYEAGQALAAYQALEPKAEVFARLAWHCVQENEPDKLAELIAARRNDAPDAPEIRHWEIEELMLREKYSEAVAALSKDEELADLEWWRDEKLVRCLLRLKRIDEAKKVLQRRGDEYEAPLISALVHAASGHAKAAQRALRTCLEYDELTVAELYDDPDLGPLLLKDEYRLFREKNPREEDE